MNTKTTKFLAVLAVFAMAFAGLALIAPAESNDAAITATDKSGDIENHTITLTWTEDVAYYVADTDNVLSATVNVKSGVTGVLYVAPGTTVKIVKGTDTENTGGTLTLKSVATVSATGEEVANSDVTYIPTANSSGNNELYYIAAAAAATIYGTSTVKVDGVDSSVVSIADNKALTVAVASGITKIKSNVQVNTTASTAAYGSGYATEVVVSETASAYAGSFSFKGVTNTAAVGGTFKVTQTGTALIAIAGTATAGTLTVVSGSAANGAALTIAGATLNAFATADPSAGAATLYSTGYTGTATFAYGHVSGVINAGAADVTLANVTGNITVNQTITAIEDTITSRALGLKLTGSSVTLKTDSSGDDASAGTTDVNTGMFIAKKASVSDAGATVNIMENATVYSKAADLAQTGKLNIYGGMTGTAPTGVGKADGILIGPTAYGKLPTADTAINNVIYGEYTEIQGTFDYDIPLESMLLKGDLTIKGGATVTIKGYVGLNNHIITIENGKLVIDSNGFVFAGVTTPAATANAIVIGEKGSLEDNGVLGANLPVMIKTTGGESVQKGISGVSYKYAKVSSTVYLRVSGNAVASSALWAPAEPSITTTNNTQIQGSLTIGVGVTYTATKAILNAGASLTTNGSFAPTDFTMKNGSTLKVNGSFDGGVKIEVQDNMPADDIPSSIDTFVTITGDATAVTGQTVTGFTLYSKRTTHTDDEGNLFYDQRAYVNGKLASSAPVEGQTASTIPTETFQISDSGKLYIAADESLEITTGKLYSATTNSANLVVLGSMKAPANYNTAEHLVKITGVGYTVTAETVTVYYFDDFETAFALIDAVDGKKITFYGGATAVLDDDITVEADQWIAISGTEGGITIPESIVMTVEKDGRVDNSAIALVNGMLTVKKGGNCVPGSTTYDVTSTNADGDKSYCGLQVALDSAVGEVTIVLTNDKTGDKALSTLSIKEGVTLDVRSNIVIKKSLTVSSGAKLVVAESGSLILGSGDDKTRKANIAGELDLSAVTTSSFNGYGADNKLVINADGILKYNNNVAFNNCTVNGVSCTISGVKVYTNLENAIEAGVSSVTFCGEYEDASYDFVAPSTIVIAEGAEVVLGEIDVSKGATITANGELSATIAGVSGVLLVPTELTLVGFVGEIKESSKTTSTGLTEYTLALNKMTAGSVDLAAGILTLNGDITIGADDMFLIEEDAILYSAGTFTITNNGSLVDTGMIDVADDKLTITTATDGIFAVGGEVAVNEDAEISFNTAVMAGELDIAGKATMTGSMVLTGTITVWDTEEYKGTLALNGDVVMGTIETSDAPMIIGDFTLASGEFIMAFPGAEFDTDGLKYTEIVICGEEYATVYVSGGNVDMFLAANEIITNKIKVTGFDLTGITTYTNWYDESGDKLSEAAQKNVGVESAIYFVGTVQTVTLKVSSVTGLSLYIDGVKMLSDTYELDVGAHSVTATVNAGYACDNMKITFDGAPVTVAGLLLTVEDDGSILAVSGDVYIPEPEPVTPEEKSEWTITTILLVILVILIAVMAVIVALRLNRS